MSVSILSASAAVSAATNHGWPIALLRRLTERLRRPKFEGDLCWVESKAVVDQGNCWDLVSLEGTQCKNPWNSVGIVVRLGRLSEGALLGFDLYCDSSNQAENHSVVGAAPALSNGDQTSSTSAHDRTNLNDNGVISSKLATIVERICGGVGGDEALHVIDSMQAIQLSEALRQEFHKAVSVTDVLHCSSVNDLLDVVQRSNAKQLQLDTRGPDDTPKDQYRRVWLCGMGPRMCTVDWMVSRQDRTQHLDVAALQRAVDRLVQRHVSLRCRSAAELPMFHSTCNAASLWQLWCAGGSGGGCWTRSRLGRLASHSIYAAWPRTTVLPGDAPESHVDLLLPTVGDVACDGWAANNDDERAFWVGNILLRRHPVREDQFFQICAIPVFHVTSGATADGDAAVIAQALPPSAVRWYIYAVIDHGYCDGPTGLPLFADLLRLYAEESGEAVVGQLAGAPPDALHVLERRLVRSLGPMPDAEHPNDDIFHDGLVGLGWGSGYTRFIRFESDMMGLLHYAARDLLGCSVDVAWLTCIGMAFLRMFPDLRRLDLFLIVTCRDKPAEETMIGYFSGRKNMPLEIGDPRRVQILGLCDMISTMRRQRTWRRPRPFEKFGAIEVNIVSMASSGLPLGFEEVRCPRSAPRNWERGVDSHMNLRLDQISRESWDFRLQSHRASWGAHWSTYYVQALGSAIVDMAVRPTGPIVPEVAAVAAAAAD